MPTKRGPISSYEKPEELAERVKARKPSVKPKRALDPDRPLDGAARFQTVERGDKPRFRNLTIYLGMLPEEDDDDDARTEAAVKSLKRRKLRFADTAYVTNDPAVVAWLRHRIYAGKLPDVEEDISMMDIKCAAPDCGYTVKNTKDGAKQMLRHNFEAHGEQG